MCTIKSLTFTRYTNDRVVKRMLKNRGKCDKSSCEPLLNVPPRFVNQTYEVKLSNTYLNILQCERIFNKQGWHKEHGCPPGPLRSKSRAVEIDW